MKTVSKKFLQKMANKTGWMIDKVRFNSSSQDQVRLHTDDLIVPIKIDCPELAEGEVIKPQEKWHYPVVTKENWNGGVVWSIPLNTNSYWVLTPHPSFYPDSVYVLPDPNKPDKPPKKNWRPE